MFDSKKYATLSILILIPILVGFLSSLFSQDTLFLYSRLNRPPLSPPPVVFPIVWTILYTLMGISSYIVYLSDDSPNRDTSLKIYALQLVLNFLWTIAFFRLNSPLLALIIIILLIISVIFMIFEFNKVSRLAALLQIPYLLWLLFALYLNLAIVIIN